MKNAKIIGLAAVVTLWAALSLTAWFKPAGEISESERRKLAQFPKLTTQTVLDGKFMENFETYTLDQFPLRDRFRQLKALFHYNALRQGDNNGIYLAGGYAAEMEYPLNRVSVSNAVTKLNGIYDKFLAQSDCKVFLSVVPDKGYCLAGEYGYPALDYAELFSLVQEGTPWAQFVDISDLLAAEDYYFTDTHWRQEKISDVADRLCDAMGSAGFPEGTLTPVEVDRPFYGVYYGQAALPMEPEVMYTMRGDILDACTVYNHETRKTTSIYDMDKLSSRDLYDVYLSGATPLLTIENPNAQSDKELVVFRDSFGSSLVPLLCSSYKTVTVVDIRYLASSFVGNFVEFTDQDVLFLYSSLVLNNSSTLK